MKGQKGITLVALIITIIVMLILVAVTVGVVVNSDLIGNAETAVEKYNTADDNLGTISQDTNVVKNAAGTSVQYYVDQANK